ncbi:adenosylcobinamide-GDP ribazoletransferase [Maritalea sp.]|uniref:adenosylcobinamide-GDP ribazoletransferase n=1 Tax=Maritalea sp. TaxID=2003361 RepID=UPI003EF6009A
MGRSSYPTDEELQLTKPANSKKPAKTTAQSPTNDNSDDGTLPPKRANMVEAIIMGLRFYSRLPTGNQNHHEFNFAAMVRPLALPSLIIGVGPAFILLMLTVFGASPLFAAAVAVALSAIITGAMAEDAFADAMDGLFGGQTIEQKLEIMHDSRHGTYGTLGIVIPFVLRMICLGTLVAVAPIAGVAIWLASGVLARSGATWIAQQLPPARADGLSANAGILPARACYFGIALSIAVSFALMVPFVGLGRWIIALLVSAIVLVLWRQMLVRLIGGQTGDTIGAAQLILEIAILSSFIFGMGL